MDENESTIIEGVITDLLKLMKIKEIRQLEERIQIRKLKMIYDSDVGGETMINILEESWENEEDSNKKRNLKKLIKFVKEHEGNMPVKRFALLDNQEILKLKHVEQEPYETAIEVLCSYLE